MYCSSCGREYRPGYTECAHFHVPLVEQLPDNMPRRRAVPRFPTIPKLPDNRPLLLKVVPYLAFILAVELILALVCGLFGVGTFTRAGKIISSRVVYFVFACWYLYAKPNVRAYYRNLNTNSGAEVQPPNTGPQTDS